MILCQLKSLIGISFLALYRRKDIWVFLVLFGALLIPLSMMQPFGLTGASRYLNEISMLLIWLFTFVISSIVTTPLFPTEFETHTIYPLLAKPISHLTLVVGKYLGAITAGISAVTLFYICYALFCGLRQGCWCPIEFWQAYFLHLALLCLTVAILLLGSLLLSSAINLIVANSLFLGMLFWGQQLTTYAMTQGGFTKSILLILYALGPHIEFFDMRQRLVHGWGPIPWGTFASILLYAGSYTLICLALAVKALKRRKL